MNKKGYQSPKIIAKSMELQAIMLINSVNKGEGTASGSSAGWAKGTEFSNEEEEEENKRLSSPWD